MVSFISEICNFQDEHGVEKQCQSKCKSYRRSETVTTTTESTRKRDTDVEDAVRTASTGKGRSFPPPRSRSLLPLYFKALGTVKATVHAPIHSSPLYHKKSR